MQKTIRLILLCLWLVGTGALAAWPAQPAQTEVEVKLGCAAGQLVPGSSCEVRLDFTIPKGAHIYAPQPGETGLPTKAGWKLPAGLSVATESWSTPQKLQEDGFTCNVYKGNAYVVATVDVASTVTPGQTLTLVAQPSWLLCDTGCRPGEARVTLSLPVVAAPSALPAPVTPPESSDSRPAVSASSPDASAETASPSALGILAALGGAFLGGILLNFMPCVFPVLSIKALELVRSSQQDRRQQRRQSLYYALGVVLSFWLVAGGLSLLRALGFRLGWGFQMQSPYFVASVAFIFVALALNLLGVYEIGLGLTRLGQEESGGRSAWLSGALAVIVATPCTAPFMGAALGVALTLPWLYGWLIFTALGLGLALPLVGLAWFPLWQRALPRPGAWMVVLRQALAFPLLLTAVYFAWIADVQAGPYVAALMVAGWVFLGAAAWLYGHWERRHRWYLLVLALVLALVGWGAPCAKYLHQQVNTIDVGTPVEVDAVGLSEENSSQDDEAVNPGKGTSELDEGEASSGSGAVGSDGSAVGLGSGAAGSNGSVAGLGSGAAGSGEHLQAAVWSQRAVQDALAAGHPVFIDFGASWCLTCQVNEQMVLDDPEVLEAFRDHGVVFFKADWTNRNAEIAQALEGYGRSGVPLYVYYAGGDEAQPQLLPEVLSVAAVLQAVNGENEE